MATPVKAATRWLMKTQMRAFCCAINVTRPHASPCCLPSSPACLCANPLSLSLPRRAPNLLTIHGRVAMEKAERLQNKGVYGTPEYRQAVDRARQRQREREKALNKLQPPKSPLMQPHQPSRQPGAHLVHRAPIQPSASVEMRCGSQMRLEMARSTNTASNRAAAAGLDAVPYFIYCL